VAIRRKSADTPALNLTFRRGGERLVEHYRTVVDTGEWHAYVGFSHLEEVAERLVVLLQATPSVRCDARALGPTGMEQARQSAAAGDRLSTHTALRSAGADAALAERLATALLGPRTLAQLVHLSHGETTPDASLTVLVASDGVWTFASAGSEVSVACVSGAGLQKQLLEVWTT
jgi:hypothetical protein